MAHIYKGESVVVVHSPAQSGDPNYSNLSTDDAAKVLIKFGDGHQEVVLASEVSGLA